MKPLPVNRNSRPQAVALALRLSGAETTSVSRLASDPSMPRMDAAHARAVLSRLAKAGLIEPGPRCPDGHGGRETVYSVLPSLAPWARSRMAHMRAESLGSVKVPPARGGRRGPGPMRPVSETQSRMRRESASKLSALESRCRERVSRHDSLRKGILSARSAASEEAFGRHGCGRGRPVGSRTRDEDYSEFFPRPRPRPSTDPEGGNP